MYAGSCSKKLAASQPCVLITAPNRGEPIADPRFWQNCMIAIAMVAPIAVLRMSMGAIGRSDPPHIPPPMPCRMMVAHITAAAPSPA